MPSKQLLPDKRNRQAGIPTHPGREVESDGIRTDPGQQHQRVIPDRSLHANKRAKSNQIKSDTAIAPTNKPNPTSRDSTYIAGRPVPPEREAPAGAVDGGVVELVSGADGRLDRPRGGGGGREGDRG